MHGGVDLNRNYDVDFEDGDFHHTAAKKSGECAETFPGSKAFSEPETRAMRDFLTSEKDSLNFVYNFHCAGNFYIIPYNYEAPNNAFQQIPTTMGLFQELISEADFPSDFKIGPAIETIGLHTGGSSGDWINSHLGIPAAEVEIAAWE